MRMRLTTRATRGRAGPGGRASSVRPHVTGRTIEFSQRPDVTIAVDELLP